MRPEFNSKPRTLLLNPSLRVVDFHILTFDTLTTGTCAWAQSCDFQVQKICKSCPQEPEPLHLLTLRLVTNHASTHWGFPEPALVSNEVPGSLMFGHSRWSIECDLVELCPFYFLVWPKLLLTILNPIQASVIHVLHGMKDRGVWHPKTQAVKSGSLAVFAMLQTISFFQVQFAKIDGGSGRISTTSILSIPHFGRTTNAAALWCAMADPVDSVD